MAIFTLARLQTELGKTEEEILALVEQGKLRACCRYKGSGLVPGKHEPALSPVVTLPVLETAAEMPTGRLQIPGPVFDSPNYFYNGWVVVLGDDVGLGRINRLYAARDYSDEYYERLIEVEKKVSPEVTVEMSVEDLREFDKKCYPMFYKATAVNDDNGKDGWVAVDLTFTKEDLVFLDFEVARFKQGNPEWFNGQKKPLKNDGAVSSKKPKYLDTALDTHPPKLMAAIAAWEAVALHTLPRNKTIKQALEDWLTNNWENFPKAFKKKDGTCSGQAIGEVAKIANWRFEGPAKSG